MIDNIFGIAGTALNAQITRLNATASNLANASTVAGSDKDAFRGKRVVFKSIVEDMLKGQPSNSPEMKGGVRVDRLIYDPAPTCKQFDPNNPMADKDGFVFQSNVNEVSEMVEMMAAARSYQNNVETVNTAKQLMMRTLDLTKA